MNRNTLEQELKQRHVRRIPGRQWLTRCGVAAIVSPSEQGLQVLLMRRAKRPGDPWSGDMSFPGGRQQGSDLSTQATAIRETCEEIGLSLDQASCIGRFSDVMTRKHEHWRPMIVTPWLFWLETKAETTTNHEAVETVWVPLDFLCDEKNRKKMDWNLFGAKLKMPYYRYQDHRIWGLTLLMLDELKQFTQTTA